MGAMAIALTSRSPCPCGTQGKDKEMHAHQETRRKVSGEKGWGCGGPKASLRRWHCSGELKEMADEAGGHWE